MSGIEQGMRLRIGADVGGAVQGVNAVERSLRRLTPGANQASASMVNLSRIVSDAPFGFIAVQNNIDPLIQSFGYLKTATGSTTGALKAMLSSLAGPAGIGLAVSLATSALTFFAMGNRSAKKEIEGFAKAQKEANAEAGEAVSKLNLLSAAASDNSRSMEERQTAVKALRTEFKPYFKELSDEAILNGRVTDAVNSATNAIIKRAKATAIASRLAEIEAKALDVEIRRVKTLEDLAAANDKLVAAETQREKLRKLSEGQPLVPINTNVDAAVISVNKVKDALQGLAEEQATLLKERNTLKDIFNAEDLTIEIDALSFNEPKIRKQAQEAAKLYFGQNLMQFDTPLEAYYKRLKEATNDFSPADIFGKIKNPFSDTILKMKASVDESIENMNRMKATAEQLGDVLTNTLGNAFQGLFEDIITGGQNAMVSFGRAIANVIKQLISAAITAAIFAAIVSAIVPGAGSFGTQFTNIFGKMSGISIGGGSASGNAANLNGVRGGAYQAAPPVILETRISGQDILLSQRRTQGGNNRFF